MKRIWTIEKLDSEGRVTERYTYTEEDNLPVVPTYPVQPYYPQPYCPAVLPIMPAWPNQHEITCNDYLHLNNIAQHTQ